MPKSESSNSNGGSSSSSLRSPPKWVAAAICLVLGIFLTIALLDYDRTQTTHLQTSPTSKNLMGWVGADLVYALLYVFGLGTWLLPFFFFWAFYLALRNAHRLVATRIAAMIVSLLSLSGLGTLLDDLVPGRGYYPKGPGGTIGETLFRHMLNDALGTFGTALLLSTAYVLTMMFVFTKEIGPEFEKILTAFSRWRQARAERKALLVAQRQAGKSPGERKKAEVEKPAPRPLVLEAIGPANKNVLVPKGGEASSMPTWSAKATAKPILAELAPAAKKQAEPPVGKLNIVKPVESKKSRNPAPLISDDKYQRPLLSLLKEQELAPVSTSEEEHSQNAANLLRILGEFGVQVTLGEIHVGPVITCYEVIPAAGVRVEKISGLDKNIALGMRAQSVRILAPIPGKAAVGVEVPNKQPMTVRLREILESEEWNSNKPELPIALGKDASGKPLISDLCKMPHLLIAGATGSGKSICINTIISSILYSRSPRDVRLIMIDPKVVELKIFNSLPHMFIPVVTEPKKVPAALKWLLREMEKRYQIFAKVNVRNIFSFNRRSKGIEPVPSIQGSLEGIDPATANDGIEIPNHMPYIVVIIDELADLMMVAPAEIEINIARLAQLARAAGIHLIIATQRPSVDVITGIIKANLPSRIAFQVASQIDSRTILDTKGAETLIGRGDMLFTPPGTSRVVRAQGAFVADDEIQLIVDYLKDHNAPPEMAQDVQQEIDRASRDENDGDENKEEDGDLSADDELYKEALEVLKSSRRASTSMLQRRLRIGYNRAARIMEIMESNGIVGPENGSSPREILRDLDSL